MAQGCLRCENGFLDRRTRFTGAVCESAGTDKKIPRDVVQFINTLCSLCPLIHFVHSFGVAFGNLSPFGRLWLILSKKLFNRRFWF